MLGKKHGLVKTNEKFGGVYGWGDGTYGELGNSDDLPFLKPQRLHFFDEIEVVSVSAGARHSLVLTSDGGIFAMGDNSED